MLYDQIYAEYTHISSEICSLKAQLKMLPTGALICAKNGNYYKWYKRDGTQLTYLKKENKKLAEELALKKYLTLQLQDLVHEQSALNMYLRHHRSSVGKAEKLLTDTSEYLTLLSSHFTSHSRELQEWANMPYTKNTNYPEQLIHKSLSGNIVRSKSEALIDMALYQAHIPYRYESALIFSGITIFPDFTIRHPKTGQEIYWEHFGMMDYPTYAKNTCSKLQLYIDHGLIPSIHLITTYETKDSPLTTDTIANIIKYYFN